MFAVTSADGPAYATTRTTPLVILAFKPGRRRGDPALSAVRRRRHAVASGRLA